MTVVFSHNIFEKISKNIKLKYKNRIVNNWSFSNNRSVNFKFYNFYLKILLFNVQMPTIDKFIIYFHKQIQIISNSGICCYMLFFPIKGHFFIISQ